MRTKVVVELMPDQHKQNHRECGNWGSYPLNGARRYACDPELADLLVDSDPDGYASIISAANPSEYPEWP